MTAMADSIQDARAAVMAERERILSEIREREARLVEIDAALVEWPEGSEGRPFRLLAYRETPHAPELHCMPPVQATQLVHPQLAKGDQRRSRDLVDLVFVRLAHVHEHQRVPAAPGR